MEVKDQDVFEIAEFIVNNVHTFLSDYKQSDGLLNFDDYVQQRVFEDLKYKYTKYQIEGIFDDPRIQHVFAIIYKGGRDDTKTQIH